VQRTYPAVLHELRKKLLDSGKRLTLSFQGSEKAHPNHAGRLPSLLKHPKMLIQFR
jgi:hypothetical protein